MPSQTTTEQNTAAGVIPAVPWRLKALSVLPNYRLAVTFQDDTSGIVDMAGVQSAENCGIFAALADPAVFAQARLDLGVATWPNGADLDPLWVYESIQGQKTWSVPF